MLVVAEVWASSSVGGSFAHSAGAYDSFAADFAGIVDVVAAVAVVVGAYSTENSR